ncbi:hypothetical protein CS063_01530 [Sporanaerobium hydrogeniformans]|uniref:Uncharacterized protein n=1 Tax=Sporanaerobium hydrogeniformans TaxID=3072179 RepID=A0AC61DGT6_9FIRM|nr:hypothetical protein [Sporanaerobium hydrogeniformans]PHV72183.1 hypothetical protein CS063_01530 [Sporanaerobium hydrogeniformans]
MISSIKGCIARKLKEIYPAYTVYDEDIPQNFKTPSFMINLIQEDYSKLLHMKSKATLSFDVAYFSGSKAINNDIQDVQTSLLRKFDLIKKDDFKIRILNKRCNTTDKVLHFLFDVNYREINQEAFIKMQKETTNTRL